MNKIPPQPNCSTSTLYLEISELSRLEKELLLEKLTKLEIEEEWGETSVYEETLFNLNVIRINGNAPYNSNDWLRSELSKLPFINKIRMEESSD